MIDDSIGRFVSEQLVAKKRRAVHARSAAGYMAIYPEIAREVLAKFPSIVAVEKATVARSLKYDAEVTASRTRMDATGALERLAKILGN
jgi:hypothetical protein